MQLQRKHDLSLLILLNPGSILDNLNYSGIEIVIGGTNGEAGVDETKGNGKIDTSLKLYSKIIHSCMPNYTSFFVSLEQRIHGTLEFCSFKNISS